MSDPATAIIRAATKLWRAQEAMRLHTGARSGAMWARKTDDYRKAWEQFDALFRRTKEEAK